MQSRSAAADDPRDAATPHAVAKPRSGHCNVSRQRLTATRAMTTDSRGCDCKKSSPLNRGR
eukprot:EW705796.1.p1 GENE.EW705796.1~~EW705796.1.p1  ORF type:complete len:61 (-),score=1.32 EW705796.1:176-358(-)